MALTAAFLASVAASIAASAAAWWPMGMRSGEPREVVEQGLTAGDA